MGVQMEGTDEKTIALPQRSAKAEWKEILIMSIGVIVAALAIILWMSSSDWVGKFGKGIEIHSLPFLGSTVFLGLIWGIRSTRNYLRCSDATPMAQDDYLLLRRIENDNPFESDRLSRWSTAVLLATAAVALQPAPDAIGSLKISILTFWVPLVMYLSAAVFAIDVTLVCLTLAVLGALVWGIFLLPTSVAVVLGAGIIAYAIYKRGK